MKGKQIAGVLIGAFIAFLGLLWTLQGTGILHIRPILCVTDCEEIVGVSASWAIAGVIAFIIGIIIIVISMRHVRTDEMQSDQKPG
jgi:phosphate/sulfate permease